MDLIYLFIPLLIFVLIFYFVTKKNIENIDEEKKIAKDKKQSWADEKYVSYGEVQKVKSELLEEVNKNFSEDKKNIITEIINEWADLRIKVFEERRSWIRNPKTRVDD